MGAEKKKPSGRPTKDKKGRRKIPLTVAIEPDLYEVYRQQPNKVAFIEGLIRVYSGAATLGKAK